MTAPGKVTLTRTFGNREELNPPAPQKEGRGSQGILLTSSSIHLLTEQCAKSGGHSLHLWTTTWGNRVASSLPHARPLLASTRITTQDWARVHASASCLISACVSGLERMILIQVNLYYTDNLDLADMSWFLKENSWCLRIPEGKGFGDIYQLFSDRCSQTARRWRVTGCSFTHADFWAPAQRSNSVDLKCIFFPEG